MQSNNEDNDKDNDHDNKDNDIAKVMTFNDKLQQLFGNHDPNTVEYLNFIKIIKNQKELTIEQKEGIEQYKSLKHICLNEIGLNSTTNFPFLPNLIILEVSQNEFEGKHIKELLELYPNLEKLIIENNFIEKIDSFNGIEGSKLYKLCLNDNPITKNDPEYRRKIFELCPNIIVIDSVDKIGEYVYTSLISDNENDEPEKLNALRDSNCNSSEFDDELSIEEKNDDDKDRDKDDDDDDNNNNDDEEEEDANNSNGELLHRKNQLSDIRNNSKDENS